MECRYTTLNWKAAKGGGRLTSSLTTYWYSDGKYLVRDIFMLAGCAIIIK